MTAAVSAEKVVLGYGTRIAIGSSSFSIPPGKVTAVIGPNGSGKSTILNAIAGLIEPMSGSIEVAADRKRVSYVLQTTKVNEALPVTVKEVVSMGRYASTGWFRPLGAADRDAVTEAMSRVDIVEIGGRHIHHLSGGQRQRTYVAQGLAQEHDILLLDEPLTGIDITTARAIDDIIHEETDRGCAVVLTTHDMSEAQAADHVLLVAGRVVASGAPDQTLTTENLAAAYGAALLHLDEQSILLDDAAHKPATDRHVHRDKSIHTESDPENFHHD